MPTNRRQFIRSLAALPLLAGPVRLLAAPAGGSARFVLVFLRGGYDAASLLIPYHSSDYYEARPTLALARPGSDLQAALPVDGDWALNPVLRESLYPLFQRRQLAFVPFAGTDDLSRSHFETQQSIELGLAAGGARDYRSGFLNRLAGVLGGQGAIAFTDQLPLVMSGPAAVPNVALRQVAKPGLSVRQSQIIAGMYRGSRLAGQVSEGFGMRDEVLKAFAEEMESSSRNAVSARGFELEARRIGKLMRERYRLGFVDVGGWDTHVSQGGNGGYLASRFDELGRGLAAFADEMGKAWDDTVVVVVSEFGRTFRENGSRGTDHGHGTVFWVLGGSVAGGRVAGEQVEVRRSTLLQDRDFPVLNDYRQVLGGLFQRQFGLSAEQLTKVFPGARSVDLELL
ncbi:DUF1501 domain-containing protein [Chitinimonas koreensis]|uniref:DUF1501 domain-containing protein n=1 Tax=Chitinimonas koreensis TaxID=356302 RepID=UPI00040DBABD|nr:DUF1501 domain-containing protein [Chitinimonas koreensis]QNM98090.1 DUF1501 domain-containing protein [Chitinimonas koreensis]